ncbi:hypothetical protein BT93_E1492 [Corymbia citriodora subsp. variegata]|nr:hypothetical protein BT93_E1492 [Corymbia citriodora subsp. variegata]
MNSKIWVTIRSLRCVASSACSSIGSSSLSAPKLIASSACVLVLLLHLAPAVDCGFPAQDGEECSDCKLRIPSDSQSQLSPIRLRICYVDLFRGL